MTSPSSYKGVAYILSAELFFVLMGTQIRAASEGLSNEMIVFFRNLLGLQIILMIIFNQGFSVIRTQRLGGHLVRSLAGLTAMYCFFYSIIHMPLANAMILKLTAPLFIPLFAWIWLKESLSRYLLMAIAVGFVGVYSMVQPDFDQFSLVALVALTGGVFVAFAKTAIKNLTTTEAPITIVFYFAFFGLVFSTIPAVLSWQTPSGIEWIHLLLLGLFSSIGQILMTRGYAHAPASQVSLFSYSSVLYASFIGWILWDEWMNGLSWFGTLLIVLSGLIILRLMKKTTSFKQPTEQKNVQQPAGNNTL